MMMELRRKEKETISSLSKYPILRCGRAYMPPLPPFGSMTEEAPFILNIYFFKQAGAELSQAQPELELKLSQNKLTMIWLNLVF